MKMIQRLLAIGLAMFAHDSWAADHIPLADFIKNPTYIREPGMFKCAAGYVGVYDMELMDSAGDIARSGSGRDFIEKTLGKDKAKLKSISPADNADKIKIPVFLAAGALDRRAPPVHTEKMQSALKKAGNPAEELIIQEGEMHGYYDEKNNLNLYTKMLAFFDRHIGKK